MTEQEQILEHYLICAVWAETDDNGEPLDASFDASDISEESKQKALDEIADFLSLLERERIDWRNEWSAEQFGHDFWLTRNGHGAGFWDRGKSLGDKLTEWAKTHGESYIYCGDDGQLHIG